MSEQHSTRSRVFMVSIQLLLIVFGVILGTVVTHAFFTLMGSSGDVLFQCTVVGGCAGMLVTALAMLIVMKRKYPEWYVAERKQGHYLIKAIPALDTLPQEDFTKAVKYCRRRASREPKAIALVFLLVLFGGLMLSGVGITTRSIVIKQRFEQHEQQVRIVKMLPPGDTRFHASEFNPPLLDRFILNFLTGVRGILVLVVICIAYFVTAGILERNQRNRTIALCPEALDALGLKAGEDR